MSAAPRLVRRPLTTLDELPESLPPLLRRLYAARGVKAHELSLDLKALLPPAGLKGIDTAAGLLADAIVAGRRIVIAGDYDCDGATGVAVGIKGLRALGAQAVGYVVPDRFRMGYGLSPALVDLAAAQRAEVLVTVDTGIASHEGVEHAKALGMTVIVTDHHLPAASLPRADAIVNPNQPGCGFASKALAGVGVLFYVLLAVRAALRVRGVLADEPRFSELLDLVALGTVADVAVLDHNNRVLVEQGLRRLRAGLAQPGLAALLDVAGRKPERLTATDLGFVLGPRLNAAGRLDDITTGIECLLAPSVEAARPLAQALDALNRERRERTAQMADEALEITAASTATGITAFDEGWHEGIVGLVATRLKDAYHRPAIAFARGTESGLLKGSARSISGCHVRDVLAVVDARHPGLILRFGGHAMAAGLTLREADFAHFADAFDAACRAALAPALLDRACAHDGDLASGELTLASAALLEASGPWGNGFDEPAFTGRFTVLSRRFMGNEQQHVRYQLRDSDGTGTEAVDFGGAPRAAAVGQPVNIVFQLGINRWNGTESVQLQIREVTPDNAGR